MWQNSLHMRKHALFVGLGIFLHFVVFLGSDGKAFGTEGSFRPHGEASLGTLFIPFRNTWGVLLRGKFSLTQKNENAFPFGFPLRIIDTTFRLTLADEPRSDYLPALDAQLTPAWVGLRPFMALGAGRIRFQRAPKALNENLSITAELVQLQLTLLRGNSHLQGGCRLTVGALGARYLHYGKGVEPFVGLHLVSLYPQCFVKGEPGRFLMEGGLGLMSELGMGQSGNGTPDERGSFGNLLFDAWFEVFARFGIRLSRGPIQTLFLQGDARYQVLIDRGNRSLHTGVFVGIGAGVTF